MEGEAPEGGIARPAEILRGPAQALRRRHPVPLPPPRSRRCLDGYGYHIDASVGGTHDRIVSGLFYLRDIVEGGETEFPFQLRHVKPKAGLLLLLFPPLWTHLHRGVSPVSAVKYNITNFVILRPQPKRAAAS
ncbi:MAG TPA: hypothetical protein VE914_02355 [Candidatus Angelobacter sp.]|nr:hypothetical protein [Candidatus Angelobacter sp.]